MYYLYSNTSKSKVLMALMVGTLAVSATSVNTLAADGSVGSTSMPTMKHYEIGEGEFMTKDSSHIYFVSDTKPEGKLEKVLKLVASESAARGIGGKDVMKIVYGTKERTRSGDIVIQLGNVEKKEQTLNRYIKWKLHLITLSLRHQVH